MSERSSESERCVLLIIDGGVLAYRSLELIRLLAKAGVRSRAILTATGAAFVAPLSVGALTGEKVYRELFDLAGEAEMGHIQLSRSADLVVVAPATASLMAKAANGLADDLASTALLATDKPVLMAPMPNVREHPAAVRNRARLAVDGVMFVTTDRHAGSRAFAAMSTAEPQVICDAVLAFYAERAIGRPLSGRRVLVTAGPTLEPLDPVRFISNRSSGKQGFAIAEALARLGADVALISGPVALADPFGVETVRVETACEMLAACEARLPADAAICVAAVADRRPQEHAAQKIKKGANALQPIALAENPDILATLSKAGGRRPRIVVGFAAETNDVEAHAQAKLAKKGCNWIVANDVSGDVMGGDANQVTLVRAQSVERWAPMAKTAVARLLAAEIARAL
jgi:phosphopantothenoylcysteine decarboxylase/phosphopantothenate--cysteine ligase